LSARQRREVGERVMLAPKLQAIIRGVTMARQDTYLDGFGTFDQEGLLDLAISALQQRVLFSKRIL